MFDTRYKYVGIGCAKHRDYGYCTVFVYAKSLRNIGDPPNVGINYIQDYIKKTMGKKMLKIDYKKMTLMHQMKQKVLKLLNVRKIYLDMKNK